MVFLVKNLDLDSNLYLIYNLYLKKRTKKAS
jgi:hypothetical protein